MPPPDGMYLILKEAYFNKIISMIPADIMNMVEEDHFRYPKSP